MEFIKKEQDDSIAILKLMNGTTNAINSQLVDQLKKELIEAKDDPKIEGLVICSSNNKFFSIGLDIPSLFDLSREEFSEFYHSFNQLSLDLFTFPKPTVAAITGHAIAGGCILTLCCDFRFIAKGRNLMGLNEIKLGVPVPYPADCMLKRIVNPQISREIITSGDFYRSEHLLQFGMVDQVLSIDEVLLRSVEKAKLMSSYSNKAFRMIKQNHVELVEEQIRGPLEEKENYFINCWYSDEVRENLKNAMKNF